MFLATRILSQSSVKLTKMEQSLISDSQAKLQL
jgi:hypothetical protein